MTSGFLSMFAPALLSTRSQIPSELEQFLAYDPEGARRLLQQAGYTTGCVGKWHLGLSTGKPDWNSEIKPGPLEVGFDYSFIIPATGDRVPCVYVENRRVVGLDPRDPIRVSYQEKVGDEPTGRERPDLLRVKPSHGHADTIVNGISRIGFMTGGKSARWVDEDMADTFTRNALDFIERDRKNPFFLYFATHDIPVPRVPHPRFAGKSGIPLAFGLLGFHSMRVTQMVTRYGWINERAGPFQWRRRDDRATVKSPESG